MVHQMGKPPGGIDGRGALLQLQAASGYTDSQTVGEWASFTLGGLWTILFHRRPEIAKQRLSECGVDKPYSDPLLQHGKTYHDFLKRLHQSKLVDYSLQPGKEQIAFFFDVRRANAHFADPAHVQLSTGESLGALEIAEGEEITVAVGDLKDAFYHVELPDAGLQVHEEEISEGGKMLGWEITQRKEQAAREEIASEDTGREAGKTGGQAAYRQWTIALRPQEVGVASKTIEFDEALALDLPYHKGVGEALHRLSHRPERYFVLPREVRPYLRPDVHINYGRMRLRPSTCFLMLQLAGVQEGSVLLDPMGGVGTIAIEVPGLSDDLLAIGTDFFCVLVLWSRSAGVLDAATTTGATTGPVDTDWTLEETDEEGVPLSMVADVSQVAEQLGLNGEVEPLADRLTLLRFYLHRDRQVASAVQMYRETIAWRQAFNLKQVMADYGHGEDYGEDGMRLSTGPWRWTWHPNAPAAIHVEPFVFFGRLPSPAPDGGPVLVWRAGLADYGGFVREELVDEMIRAYVAHFEDALQSARSTSRGRLVRARVVVDAQGFDLVNLRYLQVLHHIMRLMQDHFPEVSASVTVVRAPWSVVKLYELLKPWLSQHVQQKVCFLAEDFAAGLWAHARLKLAMLPQFLGGHVPDEEAPLQAQRVPVSKPDAGDSFLRASWAASDV
ncbi:CRAL-TRIO domain-containing protein T23G5.2 [Durusdinium trenchii]|uniref:CRAL-TRIO domain-containing protein T23G5.2 n=1 Tax=Durusdinium trenchii TaxID=1381693 RepID=A0ABP0J0A3_9DINO